jgi:Flp pilus assembly protein TadG
MDNQHSHRIRQRPGKQQLPRERGQSLVEFSLMLIFLTVLVMGVLDLGRAYFTYLALKDAAAEGAYFGSAYPQCVDADGVSDDSPGCVGANNILYRVRNTAPHGGLVDWNGASIGVNLPPVLEAGKVLSVAVAYQYQMLTPFVGAIANGQTLTLTASSSAVIVRVQDCTQITGCR